MPFHNHAHSHSVMSGTCFSLVHPFDDKQLNDPIVVARVRHLTTGSCFDHILEFLLSPVRPLLHVCVLFCAKRLGF